MKKQLLTRFLSFALAMTVLFSDISVYAANDGTVDVDKTEVQTEELSQAGNVDTITEEILEETVKAEEPSEGFPVEEPVAEEPSTEENVSEETTTEKETVSGDGLSLDDAVDTEQTTIVKDDVESVYYFVPETETSAIAMGMYSLEDGNVSIKEGTAINWIDRLNLTDAEEIRAFYDLLVEASDNDGIDDFLINDSSFESDKNLTVKEVTKSIEVSITDASNEDKVAEEIKAAVGEQAATVFNHYSPYMLAVRDAFDRDHPEVFWLSGETVLGYSCGYQYTKPASTADTVTVSYTVRLCMVLKGTVSGEAFDIRATNYRDEETIKSAIATVGSACEKILSEVFAFDTYKKLQYFNTILTTTNEYNTSDDLDKIDHDCRECISALKGMTGTEGPVCEAYARAFKVLCDKAGIPCVLVDGTAYTSPSSAGGPHMWNNVQLEDRWYGVDVTWNDPAGGSGALSGYENEDWFLVGADTIISGMKFADSHPVENRVSVGGVAFTNGPELCTDAYIPYGRTRGTRRIEGAGKS